LEDVKRNIHYEKNSSQTALIDGGFRFVKARDDPWSQPVERFPDDYKSRFDGDMTGEKK